MSRNFTTDVDTQREYFNASYFNQSGQNQIAKYETTLLKPFFTDPDKWKLAINRMRVPLSGIPLTKNNIPFHQWEVALYYNNHTNIELTQTAYVAQFNPQTINTIPLYSISSSQTFDIVSNNLQNWYIYNSEQFPPQLTVGNYSVNNELGVCYDTVYYGTFYMASADLTKIYAFQLTSKGPVGIITLPSGSSLISFTCDSNGNLYCSVNNDGNFEIISYTRSSLNDWNPSTTYNTGAEATSISICNFNNNLVCSTYSKQVLFFTLGYGTPTEAYDIINSNYPSIISLGIGNEYNVMIGNVPNTKSCQFVNFRILQNGNILNYTVYPLNFEFSMILGLDQTGNVLIKTTDNKYLALNQNTGTIVYQFYPTDSPVSITTATTSQTFTVEGGPYDIFTYQQFLNQINAAFTVAFNNMKQVLQGAYVPTEPPRIIYDATTKLFSMICEGSYLITDDSGNRYQILLNNNLWSKFLYPSNETSPVDGFHSILLQNNGINAIVGTGSVTLPQYITVQQQESTLYAFYDLVRIIVGTTLIPVSGDGEGKTFSNDGFSSNTAINMITDIVPDTNDLTTGSVIIYIPSGILRWYNLYAQQPFSKIDLILYYETKLGIIYPIQIVNGEFFSVKLEFKKGPGDF